jgi:carbonic anhydrase
MTNSSPHTAKALLLTCIDDRLTPHTEAFIKRLPGGAFHVALAGGGRAGADYTDAPLVIKQILAAYAINQVTHYYLQSHLGCGAYALAGITFADPAAETIKVYADLDVTRQMIITTLIKTGVPPTAIKVETQVIGPGGHGIERPAANTVA